MPVALPAVRAEFENMDLINLAVSVDDSRFYGAGGRYGWCWEEEVFQLLASGHSFPNRPSKRFSRRLKGSKYRTELKTIFRGDFDVSINKFFCTCCKTAKEI